MPAHQDFLEVGSSLVAPTDPPPPYDDPPSPFDDDQPTVFDDDQQDPAIDYRGLSRMFHAWHEAQRAGVDHGADRAPSWPARAAHVRSVDTTKADIAYAVHNAVHDAVAAVNKRSHAADCRVTAAQIKVTALTRKYPGWRDRVTVRGSNIGLWRKILRAAAEAAEVGAVRAKVRAAEAEVRAAWAEVGDVTAEVRAAAARTRAATDARTAAAANGGAAEWEKRVGACESEICDWVKRGPQASQQLEQAESRALAALAGARKRAEQCESARAAPGGSRAITLASFSAILVLMDVACRWREILLHHFCSPQHADESDATEQQEDKRARKFEEMAKAFDKGASDSAKRANDVIIKYRTVCYPV